MVCRYACGFGIVDNLIFVTFFLLSKVAIVCVCGRGGGGGGGWWGLILLKSITDGALCLKNNFRQFSAPVFDGL